MMEYSMMVLFCLFIIVVLYIRALTDKNIDKVKKEILILTLSTEIVLMLAEALGNMIISGNLSWPVWTNIMLQTIYFVSMGCLLYSSFLLICVMDNSRIFTNKKLRFAASIPALILIIFALITPFTGALFTVDSDNVYTRGYANFIQIVVSVFYLGTAFGVSVYKFFNKRYFQNRTAYIHIIFFTIIPIVGTAYQFVLSGIGRNYPFVIAATMISTVILYLNIMGAQVQTDFLTDLYNKNKLYTFLHAKMKSDEDDLYLVLIDINKFKYINDTYGHIEGDEALKLFGNCLRCFCRKNGYFGARYGGDEFVIVANTKDATIDNILVEIKNGISELNQKSNKEYQLSAAIGYAKYDKSIDSIPDFIGLADKMMYEDKNNAKD